MFSVKKRKELLRFLVDALTSRLVMAPILSLALAGDTSFVGRRRK